MPSVSRPEIVSSAEIVECITKNAIAADSTAVACSRSAIPSATPIAKISGKLVKTIFPVSAKTVIIAFKIVPSPKIRSR